ncbi:hypothetical protein B0H13DRAFT_1884612 [Mycena leptocephala]|nr:hypothetical protein B0H13DRAFT_1884612 [Mycena leptocephala]
MVVGLVGMFSLLLCRSSGIMPSAKTEPNDPGYINFNFNQIITLPVANGTLSPHTREVADGGPWEGLARYGVVLGRQREAGSVAATEAQGDQGRQTSADVMSTGLQREDITTTSWDWWTPGIFTWETYSLHWLFIFATVTTLCALRATHRSDAHGNSLSRVLTPFPREEVGTASAIREHVRTNYTSIFITHMHEGNMRPILRAINKRATCELPAAYKRLRLLAFKRWGMPPVSDTSIP